MDFDDLDEAEEQAVGEDGPVRVPPDWRVIPPPPAIEYSQLKDLAIRNEPGDYYGMVFPHSKNQIVDMGPKWLTEAFHKSGVMPLSNEVTAIKDAKEFVGGGAGLKCILKVEYKEDKPYLHKELFVKLPHPPGGSDRFYVSCMWNHDRPETIFNIWLEKYVPFRVPKFYFGDICGKTTNFILITENIKWSPTGKNTFEPNEIEPAYDKYKDWELPDGGPMYYTACCKALGKMAGFHKKGLLHPRVNEMFPMPGDCWEIPKNIPGPDADTRKLNAGKADQLVRFVGETAVAVFWKEITDKSFLEKWKTEMLHVMEYGIEIDCYCRGAGTKAPNDYVCLTHNNLQIDNAFFWRNESNEVEVGLLDWGVLACSPLVGALQGCISGAELDVLVEHHQSFIKAALDAYADSGGPTLDFERVRTMFFLQVGMWNTNIIANVAQVLKFTKTKEWAEITDWMDPRLVERFQTRAHTSQFRLALRLWQLLDIYGVFKKWLKEQGLPETKP